MSIYHSLNLEQLIGTAHAFRLPRGPAFIGQRRVIAEPRFRENPFSIDAFLLPYAHSLVLRPPPSQYLFVEGPLRVWWRGFHETPV